MKRFLRDESGATTIEYSLIATFMAVGLIVAVPIMSSDVRDALVRVAGQVVSASPQSEPSETN